MKRSQQLARSWFALLLMLAVISPVSRPSPASGAASGSLHWAAWDSALAHVADTPAIRYSFYAYRTFAVPNPDIYLRSDSLFSEVIEHIPGSRIPFQDRVGRDVELYQQLKRGEGKGLSFSWTLWSIMPDSIFDTKDSTLAITWLDRRLPSAAVLLRAPSRRLSTAEAATMIYTQMRRTGTPDTSLFVIIDTQGRGYLMNDSNVISPGSLQPIPGGGHDIFPAIVFNERAVYYPLFERDDRHSSASLARAVGMLGAAGIPSLTPAEKARVDRLRTAASLPNGQVSLLAAIAAFGGVGEYDKTLQKAWSLCLERPADSMPLGCEAGMVRTIVYWANRLSAPVARLAEMSKPKKLASWLPDLQTRYLEMCGRPIPPRYNSAIIRLEAWGNLWASDLIDIPFDDVIRTRSGQGSSQSLAMSAVLDLAGLPYFRVEFDVGLRKVPDQQWLIADQGRWQFNLGSWKRVLDTVAGGASTPMVLASYGFGGQFVNFDINGVHGERDNLDVSSDLTQCSILMPSFALCFPVQKEVAIPMEEFMLQLANDKIVCRPFPWPVVDASSARGQ